MKKEKIIENLINAPKYRVTLNGVMSLEKEVQLYRIFDKKKDENFAFNIFSQDIKNNIIQKLIEKYSRILKEKTGKFIFSLNGLCQSHLVMVEEDNNKKLKSNSGFLSGITKEKLKFYNNQEIQNLYDTYKIFNQIAQMMLDEFKKIIQQNCNKKIVTLYI